MSQESYENEPKERIEQCLNCPLPEYLCYGRGNCLIDKKRKVHRKKEGELDKEVLELVNQGYAFHIIASKLDISPSTSRAVIRRLKDKGLINEGDKHD